MKGNEHIVFQTNQYTKLENDIVLEVVRTYLTWKMRISSLPSMASQTLQRSKPKMIGKKKEEIGLAHHLH